MQRAAEHGIPAIATAGRERCSTSTMGRWCPWSTSPAAWSSQPGWWCFRSRTVDLDEHVRFGRSIGETLVARKSAPSTWPAVTSGHRLIPGAPAGYDPRGAQFDRAVADAFAAGDWEGLLSIDPNVVAGAGECGYRSLAVLSGCSAPTRPRVGRPTTVCCHMKGRGEWAISSARWSSRRPPEAWRGTGRERGRGARARARLAGRSTSMTRQTDRHGSAWSLWRARRSRATCVSTRCSTPARCPAWNSAGPASRLAASAGRVAQGLHRHHPAHPARHRGRDSPQRHQRGHPRSPVLSGPTR